MKRFARIIGVAASVAMMSMTAECAVITTTFAGGNSSGGGNMFDVHVLNIPITVRSLDLNLSTATYDLALYVKPGTMVGFNSNPAAWTLIGTISGVTGNGSGNPTSVDFTDFTLSAESTNGFYVQATSDNLRIEYSNGTGLGNVAASNSDLVILEGYGTPPIPTYTLFSTAFSSPRIWNGSIHYDRVLTVANSNDSGAGSLRDAIANASAGDTITFASGVTNPITLSTVGDNTYGPSSLIISNALTMEGNGIIIERDASVENFRLFYVSPTGSLTLRNVTLRDGLAKGGDGGGFYQRGAAGGGAAGIGGAIFNQGTLVLDKSTLTGNGATGGNGGIFLGPGGSGSGGGGGGLASDGDPDPDPYGSTVGGSGGGPNGGLGGTSSTQNGGAGGIGGGGGGAYRGGGYTGGAGGFGGGGGGGGGYTIGLGGPGGFGGGGGGTASSASGAVVALGGFGGGSGALGTIDGNVGGLGGGGAGLGGAVFNDGGYLAITNCTISENAAEGGNGGARYDSIAGAGAGFGGGLFNHDGMVVVINSTLANNTVATGTGTTPIAGGGGIYSLEQSGVAELHMLNVILANSIGGGDAVNDGGTVTGDHNLIETSSGLLGGIVSVTNDPVLGPLADNYGLTFTHALLSGSPAIDAGEDAACPATDQRGAIRPQDGDDDSIIHCDIGAYEVAIPPVFQGVTNLIVEAGDPVGAIASFNVTAMIGQQSVPVACTPPSGSTFPLGTNTVMCVAVDDFGVTNTVSFIVEVRYSPLGIALDTTNLTWTTGGDVNWFRQTTNTYDGVDAAASGTITHSQNTWIETMVTVPDCQIANVSFWWQVSSESNFDFLEFSIDGVLQSGRISGEVSWQQKTYTLASGAHTLKWQYLKDSSVNSGADQGWVDQVQVAFGPAPLTFVGATNRVIEASGPDGAVATFSVTATNACEPNATVYCTPASGNLFPLGTNTVDCEAFYVVTNTASFTVIVRDTTPPILTCPEDIILTAVPGQCGALVTFIAPSATDTVDPTPVVTCPLLPGTELPVGRTNILCTATDASGNTSSSTFTVSVYPTRVAPAGEIWTPHYSPQNWDSVASSADGTRLVGVCMPGPICRSTDAGTNWMSSPPFIIPYANWSCVASSSDGIRLVAGVGGPLPDEPGKLYTSVNAGGNFLAGTSPNTNWMSVASSADGTRLVAVSGGLADGLIYTSTDGGTNWMATSAPAAHWWSVASSADGFKLVAVEQGGRIHTTTDGGTNWSACESNRNWVAVASSADGLKLVAVEQGGRIHTTTNGGIHWAACETNRNWVAVASSADGLKLVAAEQGGQLYTSINAGTNWLACESNRNWSCVASSADGTKLVAAEQGGLIYTSVGPIIPLTNAPAILGATNQVIEAAIFDGAVATFSVTANNVCQPSVPVTCTPPSGSTFPLGTNIVTCVAVDAFGVTNTATFTVEVRDVRPPAIVTQPASLEVRPGTNVTFCVMATGAAPLSYQWRKDGTNLIDAAKITGVTNRCLTIANVVEGDSGVYSVTLTNAYGATNSPDATLWVTALDHFTWSTIASPQVAGNSFPATITARDAADNMDTYFTGTVAIDCVIFTANFDSGLDGFTFVPDPDASSNLWHRTSHRYASPTNCLYYGGEGNWSYDTGARNAGNVQSPTISLKGCAAPITLSFNYWLNNEGGSWDKAAVEISADGGASWTQLVGSLGPAASFINQAVDISAYAGSNILLRFNFDTLDGISNDYEGWYVDDVIVTDSLVISPTHSGNFVNGVWSGDITVLAPAANIVLMATHSAGYSGSSNPFDVPPLSPVIAGFSMAAPGQFLLQASGMSNVSYTIQSSTNLMTWYNFTNLIANPDGTFEWYGNIATNLPACFYRLVWP